MKETNLTVKLKLSSDGAQYLAPIMRGVDMVAIVAGPLELVLGALPRFGVLDCNILGIPSGFESGRVEGHLIELGAQ